MHSTLNFSPEEVQFGYRAKPQTDQLTAYSRGMFSGLYCDVVSGLSVTQNSSTITVQLFYGHGRS